jgi:TMEM175 potassium channel family protein
MIGLEPAHKKKFQLDRMIFFSDAVFAIAITLLVLEIKIPHIGNEPDSKLMEMLLAMIPKFVGFFISFFVVGQYWIVHHKLFGFVEDYNGTLLWLNLVFLLSIVLMPFSTALYSENIKSNLSFIIYCLNIFASGVLAFIIWRYIGSEKHNLSELWQHKKLLSYFSVRSLVISFAFGVGVIIALFAPLIAKFSPVLIFPALRIINIKYKPVLRKYGKK